VDLVSAEGTRRTVLFQNEGAALTFFLEQGVAFARAVAETLRAAGTTAASATPPSATAVSAPAAAPRWSSAAD
jgi:hypothetical protein